LAASPRYTAAMDEKTKEQIALFRVAVLGPLVGAQLEHGDLTAHCQQASQLRWQWLDGSLITLSARTIENWYYAYRAEGWRALMPADRKDRGSSDIRPELAALLLRAKRERPRRSLTRLVRIMVRAGRAKPGELSRSAVHRLLARHGLSSMPKRGPSAERRSYIYEFPGELLVGDGLHMRRPVVGPDGRPRKYVMLSQIDCATRYVPESIFALSEAPADQERGLKSVLLTHGLWQRYYVDLGSAYVAHSLKLICAELGIELLHTERKDPEAKGVIERWHRTWRAEVEDELPDKPLTLGELEQRHRAWLACEYHARKHSTTGKAPREHWLELCGHLRPLPPGVDLDEVFLHRDTRTVSKTGCVRWGGGRLEVCADLSGQKVELRFDPNAPEKPPRVFRDNKFVCDTVPLDLVRNAHRKRRRDLGESEPAVEPTGLDPLADLQREHDVQTKPLDCLALKEPSDEDPSQN